MWRAEPNPARESGDGSREHPSFAIDTTMGNLAITHVGPESQPGTKNCQGSQISTPQPQTQHRPYAVSVGAATLGVLGGRSALMMHE
jgi:hypothetical protein